MAKEILSDKRIKSLKAAEPGKRFDVMDAIVPGLGVRVTDKGQRSFVLVARFPGSENPTRRTIAEYGVITLETARNTAREWHSLIAKGIDPKAALAGQRAAEQRRREHSFVAVAEAYFQHISGGKKPLRKAETMARMIRAEFVNDKKIGDKIRLGLGKRPIDSITPHDIRQVLKDAVARGSPYVAHNLLSYVRTLFNWARDDGSYGLETSPCDRLKPSAVIGARAVRSRILNETEIAALWRAAGRMGYPYGPLFRLLLVTGQRKSEVAEARWSEFDLAKRLWIIPAERMKADAPHLVPLSDPAIEILEALPRFIGPKTGDLLFSTSSGRKAVNGFSKGKARLDRIMLPILKAMARKRGDDTGRVTIPNFVLHDLRRTMRTRLSSLPVSTEVAELVIAHAKPGLRRVYDQYSYLDEKRSALDLWAAKLRDILTPPPSNVVKLRGLAG